MDRVISVSQQWNRVGHMRVLQTPSDSPSVSVDKSLKIFRIYLSTALRGLNREFDEHRCACQLYTAMLVAKSVHRSSR